MTSTTNTTNKPLRRVGTLTLGICLIAAYKKSIMGADYKHPIVLTILGVIVVVLSAYMGVTTFVTKLGGLF